MYPFAGFPNIHRHVDRTTTEGPKGLCGSVRWMQAVEDNVSQIDSWE